MGLQYGSKINLHWLYVVGMLYIFNRIMSDVILRPVQLAVQWGLNALQWACINGHTDVADCLVQAGAVLHPLASLVRMFSVV